jgi:SAM-dependent methyltransferase
MAGNFWESRYKAGGNSGAGSYGEYAKHKADIINSYVEKYKIKTISDFGCGDGNQISLINGYEQYSGFDISEYIINVCKEKFKDISMKFYDDILQMPEAELTLSLDVLYHIVEEKDYKIYLDQLFGKSQKFVLIFSSNFDGNDTVSGYILHRKFTDWADKNYKNFKLVDVIGNYLQTSAQFYLFERIV